MQRRRSSRAGLRHLARLGALAALAVLAVVTTNVTQRLEAFARSPLPISVTQRFHPELIAAQGSLSGLEEVSVPVVETVRWGQTPIELLGSLGIPSADALAAVEALRGQLEPRALRAGTRYVGYLDARASLVRLSLELPDRGTVELARDQQGGWSSRLEPYREAVRRAMVHGQLLDSLEAAMRDTGAPPLLAYRLAQVLQWDLDFNRDLRRGDHFAVIYEEVWRDGRPHRVGEVIAARYENAGRTLEAFRFGADGGYYDANGRALRKQFLRSPLEFSRITSRFTTRRFHPVLKVNRPHYGVDYGAPVGTPVRATASGVVVSAGWDSGGGGKTVKIRHPNGYLTAYLHLSRFADGMSGGRRIQQGEVVGFVGATGLATGPHLDYRVQKNGRWMDPLSLRSEPVPPLEAAELELFRAAHQELSRELGSGAGSPRHLETALAAVVF